MIPSADLSPLNSSDLVLLLPGKYLIVGYPLISTLGISLAVASHLAITMLGFTAANFSAASSQAGIKFLQCPHQGA
jgi:hypothetical protein